ncbi:MAG: zinc-binding dehydrogenase [Gammaproteobacteria bacterium]
MKQIVLTSRGGPEVLQPEDVAEPVPGDGELRIDVKAVGVNFADILMRQGIYPGARKTPCVPGYEVAGVVDEVGAGVNPIWLGREVLALTDYDGYADAHVIDANRVLPIPADLDFTSAAALPLNYVTAWVLLIVMGSLRSDQTILIHNVGGGVGIAALDIANHVGARTLGTASPGKHPFLIDRGLDQAIDYRDSSWISEIDELTRGAGVDLIIDPLGPESWKRSMQLLGPAGRLGMFGISEAAGGGLSSKLRLVRGFMRAPSFASTRLVTGNRGVFGCNIHQMYDSRTKLNRWLGKILEGVDSGWVRPHVDRTFPLELAGEAQSWMEARKNTGKVILTT